MSLFYDTSTRDPPMKKQKVEEKSEENKDVNIGKVDEDQASRACFGAGCYWYKMLYYYCY